MDDLITREQTDALIEAPRPTCRSWRGPLVHTSAEADALLEQCPAPRVTREAIEARIVSCEFLVLPGTTLTLCILTLDNGFSVRGESACVNPANFVQSIGERYAFDDAFNKLWPFFGFLLAEDQFRAHLEAASS